MKTDHSCDITSSRFSWCVAVIASREQPEELLATVNSILTSGGERTIIDVLVNGNPGLAAAIAELIAQRSDAEELPFVRIWSLLLGDKANTWNQYLHRVWPGSGVAFFVDGYCRLSANALRLLDEGMAAAPKAMAGTSVPTTCRSATQWRNAVLNNGELVGGLFAFKESVMKELQNRNFNLPLGLYGYDGALGAVIAFGLDPSKNQWKPKERIFAHPEVTWITNEKKWWRPADVKAHISRTLKSALRVLVGQAFRDLYEVQRLPAEQLPRTIEELVLNWVRNNPVDARRIQWRTPLSYFALKKLRKARDWSAAETPPTLLYSHDPLCAQSPAEQTP